MTYLAKLVASESDCFGYTTYVFECLEERKRAYSEYIMCVRFPNWNHRKIDLNEIGYLDVKEIIAGVDTWFDGTKMVPYRYNNIQFMKFISKPEPKEHKFIM